MKKHLKKGLMFFAGMSLFLGATTGGVKAEEKELVIPEKLVFKARKGNVNFEHMKHVLDLKAGCIKCHHSGRGEKDGMAPITVEMFKKKGTKVFNCGSCHEGHERMKMMHKNCRSCHKLHDNAPVKCKECHIKKRKRRAVEGC